jgi:hypothetical protein
MPGPAHPQPHENQILAALPPAERERLFPHLKLVEMSLGMVLYESGDTLRHIYFPTDSIVSLLYVLKDGASAEISVVGNDGAIGVALFMGGETTTNRAIVQSAGSAYRLSGVRLKEEFEQHETMQHVFHQRPAPQAYDCESSNLATPLGPAGRHQEGRQDGNRSVQQSEVGKIGGSAVLQGEESPQWPLSELHVHRSPLTDDPRAFSAYFVPRSVRHRTREPVPVTDTCFGQRAGSRRSVSFFTTL